MKLGFAQPLAFHGQQANRQAGRVEFQDYRRQRSRRQPLQVGQRQVGDLSYIGVRAGAGLKGDLDDADAEQGSGFEVVHSAGQSEKALQRIGDIGFDILRRHAREERGDHYLWNVDGREQIHRHPRYAQPSEQKQRKTNDHDEVRIANRKSRHECLSTPRHTARLINFELCTRSSPPHEAAPRAVLQRGAIADHHVVALVQTRANLCPVCVLQPNLDGRMAMVLLGVTTNTVFPLVS